MTSILDAKVLLLNRVWQVIGEKTVREVIGMMATDAATAILIEGDSMRPVKWTEWLTLAPIEGDGFIQTQKLKIRRPTVVAAVNYAGFKKKRPKFNLRSIRERDKNKCQYTGKVLSREEATLDHVIPLSRGGENSPENVVLAHKDVNNRKGAMTPREAGLPEPVIRPLRSMTPAEMITPTHPDHLRFLAN